jgi:hypothetical protein
MASPAASPAASQISGDFLSSSGSLSSISLPPSSVSSFIISGNSGSVSSSVLPPRVSPSSFSSSSSYSSSLTSDVDDTDIPEIPELPKNVECITFRHDPWSFYRCVLRGYLLALFIKNDTSNLTDAEVLLKIGRLLNGGTEYNVRNMANVFTFDGVTLTECDMIFGMLGRVSKWADFKLKADVPNEPGGESTGDYYIEQLKDWFSGSRKLKDGELPDHCDKVVFLQKVTEEILFPGSGVLITYTKLQGTNTIAVYTTTAMIPTSNIDGGEIPAVLKRNRESIDSQNYFTFNEFLETLVQSDCTDWIIAGAVPAKSPQTGGGRLGDAIKEKARAVGSAAASGARAVGTATKEFAQNTATRIRNLKNVIKYRINSQILVKKINNTQLALLVLNNSYPTGKYPTSTFNTRIFIITYAGSQIQSVKACIKPPSANFDMHMPELFTYMGRTDKNPTVYVVDPNRITKDITFVSWFNDGKTIQEVNEYITTSNCPNLVAPAPAAASVGGGGLKKTRRRQNGGQGIGSKIKDFGNRTRKAISDKYTTGKEKVSEAYTTGKEKVSEAYTTGKEKVSDAYTTSAVKMGLVSGTVLRQLNYKKRGLSNGPVDLFHAIKKINSNEPGSTGPTSPGPTSSMTPGPTSPTGPTIPTKDAPSMTAEEYFEQLSVPVKVKVQDGESSSYHQVMPAVWGHPLLMLIPLARALQCNIEVYERVRPEEPKTVCNENINIIFHAVCGENDVPIIRIVDNNTTEVSTYPVFLENQIEYMSNFSLIVDADMYRNSMKALLQNDKVMKEKEEGEANQPKLKEYLNLRYREQQQLKRVEDKILTVNTELEKLKTREKAFPSVDDASKEKVATVETSATEISKKVDAESDEKTKKLETELQEVGVDTVWWKPRTKSALEVAKSVKEGLNKYVVDPVREKISVDYSKESLERRIGELSDRFEELKKEKDAHNAKIKDLEELIQGINPNILAVEELL